MIAVAGALELLQQLVPGRHGHTRDLFVKVAGTLIGGVAAGLTAQIPKLVAARRQKT